jgi:hypothetical protein
MIQPRENSEFRDVHAAREALARYIDSGRDISTIKALTNVCRYDVWQCVFEKEPEARRELQIKELTEECLQYCKDIYEVDGPCGIIATIFITHLTQIVEWNTPLKIQDAIKIILDTMGDEYIVALRKEAEISYERRVSIVKPYYQRDNEWVDYSKQVLDILNKS